ncbi:hypothetical protein HZC00_04035 [Candidatus Kaiserbacteria bacterium]|nr:hypothetical protein [Candidatus Kaiserbacteria bacterium]
MNNTKIVWGIIIVIIISAGIYFSLVKKVEAPTDELDERALIKDFDPRNTVVRVNGEMLRFVDGVSEVEVAPGSASKIITKYFGNETHGDLNGDGKEDIAYLITQDGGGSGTFFYVVAVLTLHDSYYVSNAFLIGDRIAPQTTEIVSGELRVNYAERKPGEPMTAQPSVGVTMHLKVTPDGVLELAK